MNVTIKSAIKTVADFCLVVIICEVKLISNSVFISISIEITADSNYVTTTNLCDLDVCSLWTSAKINVSMLTRKCTILMVSDAIWFYLQFLQAAASNE